MRNYLRRRSLVVLWLATAALVSPALAAANHPVFVEGNCGSQLGGTLSVPGTCGDWDGDGLIGTAEDADNATDRVFGTINGALGAANGGTNQNGNITIVTSGRFSEVVTITAANGNVTLQAAPGVEAIVDAVQQGAPGNVERQASPGVIVDAPGDRRVTIRNVTSRNWTIGFDVRGDSHVALIGVRAENNVNWGVRAANNAIVVVSSAEVQATGFRAAGGAGDFPRLDRPAPGAGIEFGDRSSGTVCSSTVSGNFGSGIRSTTNRKVVVVHNEVFDNDPNMDGSMEQSNECVEQGRGGTASVVPGLPKVGGGLGLWASLLALSLVFLVLGTRFTPRPKGAA